MPSYDTVAQENRYANLRANPSNLGHPALQPLQRSSVLSYVSPISSLPHCASSASFPPFPFIRFFFSFYLFLFFFLVSLFSFASSFRRCERLFQTRSMCQLLSIILSMTLLLFQRQPIFRFRRVTPPSRDVKRIRGEGKTGERL